MSQTEPELYPQLDSQAFKEKLEEIYAQYSTEEECPHDFVARDIQGKNKYWCKVCDERFEHYPDGPGAPEPLHIKRGIRAFLDGHMTLTEVAEAIELNRRQLSDLIESSFQGAVVYEDQYVLGQRQPIGQVVAETLPARITSPLDIEEYFLNNTVDDISHNDLGQFADIQSVDYRNNEVVHINFWDDTIQKVERP